MSQSPRYGKNIIALKHPNSSAIRYPLFPHKNKKKSSLFIHLNPTQFERILKFLKLGDILLLFTAMKQNKSCKCLCKILNHYLIKTNRIISNTQQRQFIQLALKRKKKVFRIEPVNKKINHLQAISQDVERTYLGEISTNQQTQHMRKYLNNVLCSLANTCYTIGYVQGFNYIIKNMYLTKFSQSQAFHYAYYLLTYMKMEDLYLKELGKVHQLCYVLQVYIFNYIPDLYFFFKRMIVPTQLYSSSWFITLFSEHLEKRIINKIWNIFLIKGWKIIIKFALSVLCTFQHDILQKNYDEIFTYMRQILYNVNSKNQQTIWQLMTSFKVTNKMIQLLSRQMSKVQNDTEIQVWKLQYHKEKVKQTIPYNYSNSKITFEDKTLTPHFSAKFCCQRHPESNSGFFHLCRNIQYT